MTKIHSKSALPAVAFAVAALVQTVPSIAHARDEVKTEAVRYGDLDLTSPQGVKALDRRLDRAVERVCNTSSSMRSMQVQIGQSECEEDAWNAIQAQRQTAIAKAYDRRDGIDFAQRSTYELPVVASAK